MQTRCSTRTQTGLIYFKNAKLHFFGHPVCILQICQTFLFSVQGIEYYENMKKNLDDLKKKHNLSPVELMKLIQDGQMKEEM